MRVLVQAVPLLILLLANAPRKVIEDGLSTWVLHGIPQWSPGLQPGPALAIAVIWKVTNRWTICVCVSPSIL